jgi:predicted transcriptional regulator
MPIKSFQGARVQVKKSVRKLLVRDIMCHKLVVFRPENTIHEVMEAFIKHRISGGPVVDASGELIGIISEADCMRQISDSRYFNMPILNRAIENYMSKEVETIDSSKSVFEAASLFTKNKRRRLPVIENQRLVGQISRKDVVIAALKMKSQSWH